MKILILFGYFIFLSIDFFNVLEKKLHYILQQQIIKQQQICNFVSFVFRNRITFTLFTERRYVSKILKYQIQDWTLKKIVHPYRKRYMNLQKTIYRFLFKRRQIDRFLWKIISQFQKKNWIKNNVDRKQKQYTPTLCC